MPWCSIVLGQAATLKQEGFHAKALLAGFRPDELKAVGFVAMELYRGGVSVQQLRALNVSLEGLKVKSSHATTCQGAAGPQLISSDLIGSDRI